VCSSDLPGISEISFREFSQIQEWEISPASNAYFPREFFGTWQVDILFTRPGHLDYEINGHMQFYVASRDSLHWGIVRPYWQVFGQIDLTGPADKTFAIESWGSLKALFR